jgi:hypothetical protein
MHKIYLVVLTIIGSTLIFNAQDFEVSPAYMNFELDPGDSQTKILTIKNHSNFQTPFTVTFSDFVVDGSGNKEIMKRNTSKNSCSEWITPEKTFFDINPGEQVELKITMQAPEDDYNTRWAVMYIQTAQVQSAFSVESGIGAGVHIGGRIAVMVYRNALTGKKTDMSIKYLKEKSEADTLGRVFTAIVENNGNTIEKCKVTFIASDLNSGEEIEFEPFTIDSYPGFSREVKFILPKTMPPGEYSLAVLLDPGVNSIIKGARLNETLVITEKAGNE